MTWELLSGVTGIICALTLILGSEYRENRNKRPTRFFCRGQQAKAATRPIVNQAGLATHQASSPIPAHQWNGKM